MRERTRLRLVTAAVAAALASTLLAGPSKAASATVLDGDGEFKMTVPSNSLDAGAPTGRERHVPAASSGGSIARMVGALAVVVGLIVGSTYLLRRAGRPRGESAHAGLLDVVARAPLGPRREAVLLRAAGHHIVVAQTPSSVQSLAHFPIDETNDRTGNHPDDFAGCLIRQGDTGGGDVSESKPEPLAGTVRSA